MFEVTIEDVRYKVFFKHIRGQETITLFSRNRKRSIKGKTMCIVKSRFSDRPQDDFVYLGSAYAFCSIKDDFNKNIGRRVSLDYFLQKYIAKDKRKPFWDKYREVNNGW